VGETCTRGVTVIEVTLGKNLVTCERPTFPVLHPLVDLTEDLAAARTVISAAARFFWLHREPVYSGVARKLDSYDGETGPFGPCYYVQLWQDGRLLRTVAFRNIGYVGVLHVDLTGEEPFRDDPYHDVIGTLCEGAPSLPEGYAEKVIGYVSGGQLEIAVPYVSSF